MKLKNSKLGRAGHVLVTTIVIAGCLGIALAAYLNLMMAQVSYTARSQTWNNCMPLVEAGIEEALAHMNYTLGSNLVINGWSYDSGVGAFTKTRNFGVEYYSVQIFTNVPPFPYIISKGYVPAPITAAPGGAVLAQAGPTPGIAYICRTVKVKTKKEPEWSQGMIVRVSIKFNGNNVSVDSYDSSEGPYVSNQAHDKVDVICDSDLEGVTAGNVNIKGHVVTGPNTPSTVGPNSSVGSVAWVDGGNKGVQDGWWRSDANVYIPPVEAPWIGGAYTPTNQGAAKYVLNGGNYELSQLKLTSSEQMLVKADSTLWVKGGIDISGAVKINSGCRLIIYCSRDATFAGTWYKSRDPSDLIIYGLPSCTQIKVNSQAHLECVIQAPDAEVSLIGSANLFGAITANSVSMNGNTFFHYDENLTRFPAWHGFIVTSWQEL